MLSIDNLYPSEAVRSRTARVPFHPIFMHFAARCNGSTYGRLASDYRVLVESHVKCMEMFGHDCVWLISDPYRETAAFGAEISFPDEAVPRCREPVITCGADLAGLSPPDIRTSERTRDRILAARYYRELLGDKVPVIGWIEGPLAGACNLAGVQETLMHLVLDPGFVDSLMDVCLATGKEFAGAQIDEGVRIMGVGDAICSQISPLMYRTHVMPRHRELFDDIHDRGAAVKLHICGDITHLLPLLAGLPIDILDLDWMVDMGEARRILGGGCILCGNLNPVDVIRNGTRDTVVQAARELVGSEELHPFVLSGGCEITADTPHDNIHAMNEARF